MTISHARRPIPNVIFPDPYPQSSRRAAAYFLAATFPPVSSWQHFEQDGSSTFKPNWDKSGTEETINWTMTGKYGGDSARLKTGTNITCKIWHAKKKLVTYLYKRNRVSWPKRIRRHDIVRFPTNRRWWHQKPKSTRNSRRKGKVFEDPLATPWLRRRKGGFKDFDGTKWGENEKKPCKFTIHQDHTKTK